MPAFMLSALTPVVETATSRHFTGRPDCLAFLMFLLRDFYSQP